MLFLLNSFDSKNSNFKKSSHHFMLSSSRQRRKKNQNQNPILYIHFNFGGNDKKKVKKEKTFVLGHFDTYKKNCNCLFKSFYLALLPSMYNYIYCQFFILCLCTEYWCSWCHVMLKSSVVDDYLEPLHTVISEFQNYKVLILLCWNILK